MQPPDGPAGGRFVRVAVDAQVDRPERTFTYRWPLAEAAEAGALVLVPYGGRLALGYLLGDAEEALPAALPVEAIVSSPLLTTDLLALADGIAVRYRAPIGTTLAAMLPPGIESRLERWWELLEPLGEAEAGAILTESQVRRLEPRATPRWIESRRRAGSLRARWRLRPPSVASRRERTIRRSREPGAPLPGALQRAVLDAMGEDQRCPISDLAWAVRRAACSVPPAGSRRAGGLSLGGRTSAGTRWPTGHRDVPR